MLCARLMRVESIQMPHWQPHGPRKILSNMAPRAWAVINLKQRFAKDYGERFNIRWRENNHFYIWLQLLISHYYFRASTREHFKTRYMHRNKKEWPCGIFFIQCEDHTECDALNDLKSHWNPARGPRQEFQRRIVYEKNEWRGKPEVYYSDFVR